MMNGSGKPKLSVGQNKPKSMYNSDCSSSSSLSGTEVFLDSPDSGVNYPSLRSLENKQGISTTTNKYNSAQGLNKWSSDDLHSSTPKVIPPVPKARKNVPNDVKKECNGRNSVAKVNSNSEYEQYDSWSTTSSSKSSPVKNIVSTPKNNASIIYSDSKFFTPYEDARNISHDDNFNRVKKPPDKPLRKHKKRMSIDGDDLIEVEKLEQALGHLGIDPSPEQWKVLLSQVETDAKGFVKFGDFTAAVREVFHKEMKSFYSRDNSIISSQADSTIASKVEDNTITERFLKLENENEKLKKEISQLKETQLENEKKLTESEIELKHARQQCQNKQSENEKLKSEVESAKNSTVVTLDHDFGNLARDYLAGLPDQDLTEEEATVCRLQKRVTILTCQLRKAEVTNQSLEVATNQLLDFADHVRSGAHSSNTSLQYRDKSPLPGEQQPKTSKSKKVSRAASLHSVPPPPYPGHKVAESGRKLSVCKTDEDASSAMTYDTRTASLTTLPATASIASGSLSGSNQSSPSSLAIEAKNIITSVRSLLQTLPLPNGWEEGYTPDGNKFYIHHLTQTTSWLHPRSKMVEKSKAESRRSSIRSEISWV